MILYEIAGTLHKMHTNRLFLFASFAIVRSFFRLFAQYDYHINQCNTSLLNKHRIIYKIMRASLMQRHSTTATDGTDHTRIAMHHSHRPSHTTQRALRYWAVHTYVFMNLSATVSKYSSMVRRPFFFRCIFLIYLFRNVTAQRTHPCRAHAYE